MWWGHVLPANGQGTRISGSRGSDAQTNLHSRIPEARPHHHILRLLITWAGRETPARAPNNVVNLDVTCFDCGLHSRAWESFCRKYSILMMFMVTDIRMGEFCECCQAGWPVIGSHLVSENWPSVERSPQIIHKIGEPWDVWSDYWYSSLEPQRPSFCLFFLLPWKLYVICLSIYLRNWKWKFAAIYLLYILSTCHVSLSPTLQKNVYIRFLNMFLP